MDGGSVEDDLGGGFIEAGLAWLDAVHLAAGHCGCVDRTVGANMNRLHGQFFGGE